MALIAAASAAFRHSLEVGSNWALALIIVGIPVYGYLKGVKVYEAFVEGAKEGFQVAVRIIPFLVAVLAAVGAFRAAGAMDALGSILAAPGLGPDSYAGRLASVLQGSTETTFYVLSVYCGAAGIVRYRHALAAGLCADASGLVATVIIARLLWG